jgi:hypothetical protein
MIKDIMPAEEALVNIQQALYAKFPDIMAATTPPDER